MSAELRTVRLRTHSFQADAYYEPGTVLVFGGASEVTASTRVCDHAVAGVVLVGGKNPYLAQHDFAVCKVTGPVRIGQLIVTSFEDGHGMALVGNKAPPECVFGISMSDCYAEEDQTSEIRIKLRLSQPISTLHKIHATSSGALEPEMSAWLRGPRNHDDTGAVLSLRSRFSDPTFCSSLVRRTGADRQAAGDVGAMKRRARGEQ